MSPLRPDVGGALFPRRRASDSGTTVVAIATVLTAILLYALFWWVLGTADDGDEVDPRGGRVGDGAAGDRMRRRA